VVGEGVVSIGVDVSSVVDIVSKVLVVGRTVELK
jgi:hypothetical protein